MTRLLFVFGAALAIVGVPGRAGAQTDVTLFEGCKSRSSLYLELIPDPVRRDKQVFRGGPVEFACDDTKLFADEVVWDGSMIIATGHVVFSQAGLYVSADRAEIDRQTRLGVFFNAAGVAQLTDKPIEKNMFGTLEPQVMFHGARIEKIGPRSYRISDGGFSTCAQPTPRWEIVGSQATVTLDERIVLRNAVLKVKNVPIGYLPFLYYPLGEDDRSTGFLIPSYSTSTLQGTGLSNAFFLVLGRSQDAMFKHTWFSKGGQVMSGAYRFVSAPGSEGDFEIKMINEPLQASSDGIVTQEANRSVRLIGNVNQGLPHGFRAIGNINYFTDLRAEQLYQQNFFYATQRERFYSAALSGTVGSRRPVTISASAQQNDTYYSDRTVRYGSAPRVGVALADKAITAGSPVTFGASGEMAYLIRQEDLALPETNQSLLRFDGAPRIRAPLSTLPWLSVLTEASWRMTHWLESLDPAGVQVPIRLTRNLFDLRARAVGPVFKRVWSPENNGYAQRIQHLIEPEFSIQWLSPFDRLNEVVRHDGTDTQVGGTTSIGYALSNRILVRRRRATGPGEVRQILSVTLAQTYYSNQLAGAFDTAYQSAGAGSFSPLRLRAAATPAENVSANFQMEIDAEFRKPRSYSLGGTLHRRAADITANWTRQLVIPGLPGFEDVNRRNSLGAGVTVRPFEGRVHGRYDFNLDVRNRSLLQQRILLSYNAQCCGVNVDYQTFSLNHLPNAPKSADRRFGISFTLAGIGSFSNPLGSFGNNSQR